MIELFSTIINRHEKKSNCDVKTFSGQEVLLRKCNIQVIIST